MKLPQITLFAAAIAASTSLNAAVFNITIDALDQQYTSNGTGAWSGQATARVGQANGSLDPKTYTDGTLPFALPTIPDGESIISAILTVNLEGWTSFASNGPVQLFGIERSNASAAVVFATDFVDAETPGAGIVTLDTELVPYSAISGSNTASNQTDPHSSVNISSFVQSIYDSHGGEAGEFAFLTMAVDNSTVGSVSNNYYTISTANSATTSFQPVIVITTGAVPEPSTYALFLGAAVGLIAYVRRRRA